MSYEPTEQERAKHRDASDEIVRLLSIMSRLRAPDGCPWDREQTMESLRPYLLEETFEVLEAIDKGDAAAHVEELGDLLLQIVFQAQIAGEEGRWNLAEVARGISEKLLFRHPHVFGDVEAADAKTAYESWEKVKAKEKKRSGRPRRSVVEGVPKAAPALMRADRIGEKAAASGFDWPDLKSVRAKVDEELRELDEAIAQGDHQQIQAELGDLLLALANLGRFVRVHPEDALREAVDRFVYRFQKVEAALAAEGKTCRDLDIDALEERWQEAKR